ncbi:MAG: FAD-dependent oxidoreductase [Rhodococcus sp. (in: high G+C Gram-positive bacteria)]
MPHVVTQSCCADASCVLACPVNCIHPAPGEAGFGTTEMLFVDPATCVGCSACVTACPVGAIVPDTALTDAQLPFSVINAEYYQENPHADRTPLALVPPQRRLTRRGPFRVAIVGAGPAGLYTADELLKHPEVTSVDVFDRLLTPHGLVRHGVAPDHASTKHVSALFDAIENQPGFRYVLGVEVGKDVTAEQLGDAYHAVVHAVGASSDRALGVAGENLSGSMAATELVGWYNGHPDRRELSVDLSHQRVVVVGNGNVALDVARILTRDPAWLGSDTDVAPHALDALRSSAVREVQIIGRRGPAEAAFTMPELVGLSTLEDVDVVVDADPDLLTGADSRSRLLAQMAARPAPAGNRRRIVLTFAVSPVEILGADRVTGIRVARNSLARADDGTVIATPTSEEFVIDAGLVVRAVGFHGTEVPGLPFDEIRGIVPNDQGRVSDGQYVVGWIKRGPRGFIGTNKTDAQETVEQVLDHLDSGLATPRSAPDALLATTCPHAAGLREWRRLDRAEVADGRRAGRPRVKIVDPERQRAVVRTTSGGDARRFVRT